ncbi:MAG: hypothetical protein R3Y13_04545 [bacterium]
MKTLLSRKFEYEYKNYVNILKEYKIDTDLENKNLFEILYYDVSLCEKIDFLEKNTLKQICDFIYNVSNEFSDWKSLVEYFSSYNFVINNNREYNLINGNYDLNELSLSEEDIFIIKELSNLYKLALYELCYLKKNKDYLSIPLDHLMNVKNSASLSLNQIVKSEIINSSYGRINNLTYTLLNDLKEEKLLELHTKCREYSFLSIKNGIYKAPESYCQVSSSANLFLVRSTFKLSNEVGSLDIEESNIYNCNLISTLSPNVPVFSDNHIIVGYSDIESDQILFVSNTDISLGTEDEIPLCCLYDIKELNERTCINNTYNEILISSVDKYGNEIKPSYIVQRDELDVDSLSYAKSIDKPIVRMRTNKKTNDYNILSNLKN